MAWPASKSVVILLWSSLKHKTPVAEQQKDLKMSKEAEKSMPVNQR